MAVNNVNLGGAATTGGITLTATETGLLSETGSGTVIGGPTINLTAGTGGIFLNINTTGTITANGGGIVGLGNLSFGTSTITGTAGNGGAAGTNRFTLGSNGSVTINNVSTASGNIILLPPALC